MNKDNPFTNKFYGIKSRNEGAFLAFSDSWFKKYQIFLLIALNMPVLSILVRYMMRLHQNRVFVPICKITPSNVTYWKGYNKRTLVAYTHVKFSKRIYFSLRWLWWALHYIDEALNYFRISEQVSFGFATLTVRPDPNTEATSVDGYAAQVDNMTFTDIRNANGSHAYDSEALILIKLSTHNTTDKYNWLTRGFLLFDTSPLGNGANITDAKIYMISRTEIKSNGNGETDLHIAASNPASNTAIVASDYTAISRTSFGSISYADFPSAAWTLFSIGLNSDGLSAISKTSISKFSLQLGWDIRGTFTGTWGGAFVSTHFYMVSADQSGTWGDPYLTINYSTSAIKTHIGTAAAECKKHIGTASAEIKKHIGTT